MEARTLLSTILRKRTQVLATTIVLSVFMAAMAAFAASELITAKKGGTVELAPGVELVFRPGTVEEDVVVTADMKVGRKRIKYDFGPDGLVFLKPARFIVSLEAIGDSDVDDLVLYGEDGEEIEPKVKKDRLVYDIEHFSRYYHRRR